MLGDIGHKEGATLKTSLSLLWLLANNVEEADLPANTTVLQYVAILKKVDHKVEVEDICPNQKWHMPSFRVKTGLQHCSQHVSKTLLF